MSVQAVRIGNALSDLFSCHGFIWLGIPNSLVVSIEGNPCVGIALSRTSNDYIKSHPLESRKENYIKAEQNIVYIPRVGVTSIVKGLLFEACIISCSIFFYHTGKML